MARIVLHIGLPKTGSSALQSVFTKHNAQLAALGIHYPLTGLHPGEIARGLEGGVLHGNAGPLRQYLTPSRRKDRFDEAAFERAFEERFVSPNYPNTLISSERLSVATPEMLERFRKLTHRHDVVVVAFVRDIYAHALSWWGQSVKEHRSNEDFAAFAQAYRNPQVKALRTYTAIFGRDRMRVAHYETVADNLVEAFFRAAELRPLELDEPARRVNRNLSDIETQVMAEFNTLDPDGDSHGPFIFEQFERSRPSVRKAHDTDPAIVASFESRFGRDVEWVNATFFGQEVLRVHREAPNGSGQTGHDAIEVWRDVTIALLDLLRKRERQSRILNHVVAFNSRAAGAVRFETSPASGRTAPPVAPGS